MDFSGLIKLLNEDNQTLREIWEIIPVPVYFKDINFRYLSVNKAFEQFLRKERKDILGKTLSEVYPVPLSSFLHKKDIELFEGEAEQSFETIYNPFEGINYYVKMQKKAMSDSNGNLTGLFGMIFDLTDKRKAEIELKQKEEKYRLITENVQDAIWVYNVFQQRVTYISPSVERLSGFTPDEIIANQGKSLAIDGIINSFRESFGNRAQDPANLTEIPKPFVDELQVSRKDGGFDWVEVTSTIRKNANDEIELIGVARKINKRKKYEFLLKHRIKHEKSLAKFSNKLLSDQPHAIEKGLKHILNTSRASRIYIYENFTDENNRLSIRQTNEVCASNIVSHINNSALQHVSYDLEGLSDWKDKLSKNKIINCNLNNCRPSERELLERQSIKAVLLIPIWVKKNWFGFIGFDNTYDQKKWNEDDINLLRTSAEILGLYFENRIHKNTILSTNTELKELNETKNKLFSILAHDLKSSVGNQNSFLDLIQRVDFKTDYETAKYYVSIAQEASKTSLELLDNLLNWSRSQLNAISIDLKKFTVKPVLKDTLLIFTESLQKKDIDIITNIDRDLEVYADANIVKTVFRNLISNAIKFTPHFGKITITAKTVENLVIISVKDTGVGMDPERVKAIYNFLDNISTSGTDGERGSGLGLMLAHHFLLKCKGKLWVESELGMGSTFYFSLPAKK